MLGELRSVHSSAEAAALLWSHSLGDADAWLVLPTHPAPPSRGCAACVGHWWKVALGWLPPSCPSLAGCPSWAWSTAKPSSQQCESLGCWHDQDGELSSLCSCCYPSGCQNRQVNIIMLWFFSPGCCLSLGDMGGWGMALGRRSALPTFIHREMSGKSWELQLLRVCMRVWAVSWGEGECLRPAQRHETPAEVSASVLLGPDHFAFLCSVQPSHFGFSPFGDIF